MPNLYTRATALPNVTGRLDYIGSDHRQENLLAFYDSAADLLGGQFWQQLAKESQAAFEQFGQKERPIKHRETGEMKMQKLKCCQGRELVLQISNSLREKKSDDEIVRIAVDAVSKAVGQPVAGALHFNKSKSNLHLHLIFPERELLKDPVVKVADRALFFDAQGKRRYKKSEILDAEKQLLPGCRIVKKGEVYDERHFGSVDTKYSSKAWMKDLKTNVLLGLLNGDLRGDVEYTEFDPSTGKLPQQHVGKRDKAKNQEVADRIREYNQLVRRWNWLIDHKKIDHKKAMATQASVLGARRRNADLQESIDEIEEAIRMAEAERKKQAQEWENWSRYQVIRNDTWMAYRGAQRVEMAELRECTQEMRELFEKNSTPIYRHGKLVGRQMKSPLQLELSGYYDKMDRLKAKKLEHEGKLQAVREYEDISRGRQKIMRSLILAGADQSAINAAMREFEEASRKLQLYVQRPDLEEDPRRMAAAKASLELAQKRAAHYVKKLTEEQLNAPEACEVMAQVDSEYENFQEEHAKEATALEAEMAAAADTPGQGKKASLADQIAGAESRKGTPGRGTPGKGKDHR